MSEQHPLVGAWRVVVRIPAANLEGVNLAVYGADGTATVAFPSPVPAPPNAGHRLEYFTTAVGSWIDTGDGSVAQTFVSLAADENGNPVGTHTVLAEAKLAADGQTWSGAFRIDVSSPTGNAQGSISGTVDATRIGVTRLAASTRAAPPS
jgi:hypothetical protein